MAKYPEPENCRLGAEPEPGQGTGTDPVPHGVPAHLRERYTADELDVLGVVARDKGWEYADRYAERFLAEAKTFR